MTYAEESVTFVDVTDKANPSVISHAFYPTYGYTHQGTFTTDWRYLLVDDELDETNGSFPTARTIVLDVLDLDDVEFVGAHFSALSSTDHNQYVRGDYVFQANYTAGLRILDTENVSTATLNEVGYFDTFPTANQPGFDGLWMAYPFFASGNIIAGDRDNGLFVLRPTFDIVAGEPGPTSGGFSLTPPAPNPTSAGATATLVVERAQYVRAEAFDALGRRVADVFNGTVAAGVARPLTIETGDLPAGAYILRVTGEIFAVSARFSVQR